MWKKVEKSCENQHLNLCLIKHGYPKNHNDSMSINRIVLWASFFKNLNLFKWVVWQGRVTKLLHLSESGPVCRCIQQKQTKQKCRADGESQRKDQIIRQLREKKLQVVSTVLTAPFIRQKVHLALEILDLFFFQIITTAFIFHTHSRERSCLQ